MYIDDESPIQDSRRGIEWDLPYRVTILDCQLIDPLIRSKLLSASFNQSLYNLIVPVLSFNNILGLFMSTTIESAKSWVLEKNPTKHEIKEVLTKLEARIESWDGDEEQIQGSIDAALFLQSQIESTPSTETPLDAEATHETQVSFDSSSLIPNHDPIELEDAIKKQTFEALKAQLGKTLK